MINRGVGRAPTRVHRGMVPRTQPAQAFRGSHSMADPVFVLPAWLRHATRNGSVLPAGTVVTTGTWCGLLPARAGDEVEVQFDGIGAAHVRL
jgi:2-keto-4-pentenoate hydratase